MLLVLNSGLTVFMSFTTYSSIKIWRWIFQRYIFITRYRHLPWLLHVLEAAWPVDSSASRHLCETFVWLMNNIINSLSCLTQIQAVWNNNSSQSPLDYWLTLVGSWNYWLSILNFGWDLSHLSTLFVMSVQQTDMMNGASVVLTLCACRLLKARMHTHTVTPTSKTH